MAIVALVVASVRAVDRRDLLGVPRAHPRPLHALRHDAVAHRRDRVRARTAAARARRPHWLPARRAAAPRLRGGREPLAPPSGCGSATRTTGMEGRHERVARRCGIAGGAGIVSGAMPLDDDGRRIHGMSPRWWASPPGWPALFLLFFLGIVLAAAAAQRDGSAMVVGAGCAAAAIVLMRMHGADSSCGQLAVASSLAGQALVVYGFLDHDIRTRLAGSASPLFEIALVAAAPEIVHRVLSTLAATLRAAHGARRRRRARRLFPPAAGRARWRRSTSRACAAGA